MRSDFTRRGFLATATQGALLGTGALEFLSRLPAVSAAESGVDASIVRFLPEIESLVRLLEDTPRERVIEEVGQRIRKGTTLREVLAATFLAGIRNIQPRPVGFKFHAVLVVNSAHLASQNSPDCDRWLPVLWAVDQFKSSQARDKKEGDWTMEACSMLGNWTSVPKTGSPRTLSGMSRRFTSLPMTFQSLASLSFTSFGASSFATAVATLGFALPRAPSFRNRDVSLSCAFQAMSQMGFGKASCRHSICRPMRGTP